MYTMPRIQYTFLSLCQFPFPFPYPPRPSQKWTKHKNTRKVGVFKTRNAETAKQQNDEMAIYISVFRREKAKTEFQNPIEACTKTFHSPTLHRKLEIIGSFHTVNSCRVPLELILTLNCLQYTPSAEKTELPILFILHFVRHFTMT